MTEELLEIEKQTLQEYYDRLLRTNLNFKYLQLRFLWDYIHETECFKHICDLLKSNTTYQMKAYDIVDLNKVIPLPKTHLERIYWTYFIVEQMLQPNHDITIMSQVGRNYAPNKEGSQEHFFELFNDLFLEPFIYFNLHHASRHFLILGLLKKYKHRTEWFNKDWLLQVATTKTKVAEKKLKENLFKYLFDQGLNFFIEPSSPSGEIDFIASQKNSPNKVLAEGKIFDSKTRGKQYIVDGVWQLLTYIKENNENEGYLLVYNICSTVLSLNFGTSTDGFQYCTLDNKRIYIIVVDICSHDKPASKRGQQEITEISSNDLTL